MSDNRAVVVDPQAAGRLVIRPVAEPVPDRGEAVVRVRAISLNRGEVRRSGLAPAGWRPGWDLAGEIARAAADGSGPRVGTRVVGLLPEGAWAERVAVPTHALAELPDTVTSAQAATFPVAGLTALHALAKRGQVLGRRVLVTGATGGVGDFAVQLARLAGAHVTASARRADQGPALRQLGAHGLDDEVTFDARNFFVAGRTTLYGFYLFTELGSEPASVGLRNLADLVAAGQLAPHVSLERPWAEIAHVAQDLMARRFPGKAVLTLE